MAGQSLCLALRRGHSRLQLEVGVEMILDSGASLVLHNSININTDYLHPDNNIINIIINLLLNSLCWNKAVLGFVYFIDFLLSFFLS